MKLEPVIQSKVCQKEENKYRVLMHTCTHTHVCVYVCVCVCIYIYIYVYIYMSHLDSSVVKNLPVIQELEEMHV